MLGEHELGKVGQCLELADIALHEHIGQAETHLPLPPGGAQGAQLVELVQVAPHQGDLPPVAAGALPLVQPVDGQPQLVQPRVHEGLGHLLGEQGAVGQQLHPASPALGGGHHIQKAGVDHGFPHAAEEHRGAAI